MIKLGKVTEQTKSTSKVFAPPESIVQPFSLPS